MDSSSKIVQGWFKKANEDLIVAAGLLAMQNTQVWAAVGFHCQQAAEKAIKGFLAHQKIGFTKTHDIGQLISFFPTQFENLNELLTEASDLTPFAVEYRYPDAAKGELTIEDIMKAYATSRQVVETLAELIAKTGNEELL